MRVPKVRAGFSGDVIVSEGRSRKDRALRYVGYTIHVRRSEMMLAVPMHRRTISVQQVDHVDYYPVALAHL